MIDLNELAIKAYDTARKREQNGANVKTDTRSMIKHCATEVVEAMEAFCLCERISIDGKQLPNDFSSELADIITCVLIIAGGENIDIEQALADCQEKNRKRAEGIGDKK